MFYGNQDLVKICFCHCCCYYYHAIKFSTVSYCEICWMHKDVVVLFPTAICLVRHEPKANPNCT